ncbi:hypothetical protein AKJ16_DCAP24059 [Drosera capensis]
MLLRSPRSPLHPVAIPIQHRRLPPLATVVVVITVTIVSSFYSGPPSSSPSPLSSNLSNPKIIGSIPCKCSGSSSDGIESSRGRRPGRGHNALRTRLPTRDIGAKDEYVAPLSTHSPALRSSVSLSPPSSHSSSREDSEYEGDNCPDGPSLEPDGLWNRASWFLKDSKAKFQEKEELNSG